MDERVSGRSAVLFGAGNIGRGFIAQLFREGGLELVFVDVAEPVLAALNERGAYTIHVVGPDAHDVLIDGVRALDARNAGAVAKAVARCAVACTAVGAAALPAVARTLAGGLALRQRTGGGPLNVLICENLHDAAGTLREMVARHLEGGGREAVLAATGFVQAVVSRMVPLQTNQPGDPLSIRVEGYKRLPVDARAIVGELPAIPGVEPVANFAAHVERKLYTHNCAHATLGYLGWQAGIEFGWQALEEPGIRRVLDAVLVETGEALIRKHGFDRAEHAAHVADLLRRFANRDLGDTCFRLARDPLRKLAPDDRLVGAARLCESLGFEPEALAGIIAAALRFDAADDRSAVELQRRIAADGLAAVLRQVCGVAPDEPLGQAISSRYPALP